MSGINSAIGARQAPSAMAIHVLPCSIAHDGPANVSSFFLVEEVGYEEAKTTGSVNGSIRAHFRGRALEGEVIIDRNLLSRSSRAVCFSFFSVPAPPFSGGCPTRRVPRCGAVSR